MSAAINLQPAQAEGLALVQLPHLPGHDFRSEAVAKFRELADRLESGELAGARVQWSERVDYVEIVEVEYTATEYTNRLYRQSADGVAELEPEVG
jgi:hypothetical protein